MKISTQEINNMAIVTVNGRVDRVMAANLEVSLSELVRADIRNIVIDLHEVDYVSSPGLRALVSALNNVKNAHGDLRLCSLSPRIAEIFHLAGLTTFFRIYSNQADAVGSFQPSHERVLA